MILDGGHKTEPSLFQVVMRMLETTTAPDGDLHSRMYRVTPVVDSLQR